MKEAIGDIPIVAEDLGDLSPGVEKLLKDSGYPGMKVLEFAFDGDEENDFLPENFEDSNCVVYTGTHDNDTIMGWYSEADPEEIEQAEEYCDIQEGEEFNWCLIRTAYESIADYAVIQMQDILGLGSEARMNVPSTLGGNWVWRIDADAAARRNQTAAAFAEWPSPFAPTFPASLRTAHEKSAPEGVYSARKSRPLSDSFPR